MHTMNSPNVIDISSRRDRVARAIDARRSLESIDRRSRERPRGGRAWVNGVELGGRREALTHLTYGHD
jgi:hypothetical protein